MKYVVTIIVCLGLLASLLFVSGKTDWKDVFDKDDAKTSETESETVNQSNDSPLEFPGEFPEEPTNGEDPGADESVDSEEDSNIAVDPADSESLGEVLPAESELIPPPVDPSVPDGPGAE